LIPDLGSDEVKAYCTIVHIVYDSTDYEIKTITIGSADWQAAAYSGYNPKNDCRRWY